MNKIMVPKELQDQIIDLYVNKQYGMEKIKKILNLPFGQTVIKKVLKENNIHIRTYQESSKINTRKIIVPQEMQDEIIKAYNDGWGLDKIVRELQLTFSFDKVRSILKENNIHIRNVKESAAVKTMPDLRKYSINDEYNFNSHNGAWLLGFIMSDGYLPITKGAKNRVTISLQRKDENALQLIKEELCFDGPINQYLSTEGYPFSSLSFTSKEIRKQLEDFGICNNKTFKLNSLPDLDDEYMVDFLRGFFDGDGSVYETENRKMRMNITCASRPFIEQLNKAISKYCGVSEKTIHVQHRKNDIYSIGYGLADSIKIGNIFYNNNYIALPRKKEHFFELKKKHNLT